MRRLAAAALLAVLAVACRSQAERDEAELSSLKRLGDAVVAYYQVERAQDAGGSKHHFPISDTVCIDADRPDSDAAAQLFAELRFKAEEGVRVCYRADAKGQVFAAWTEAEETVHFCQRGGSDRSGPIIGAVKERDSCDFDPRLEALR